MKDSLDPGLHLSALSPTSLISLGWTKTSLEDICLAYKHWSILVVQYSYVTSFYRSV
jgi:hypothetical protein